MRKVLIPLLAALTLPTAVNAVEINCNSSIWKNKPRCKDKKEKITRPILRPSEDDLGGADIFGDEEYSADSFNAKCGKKLEKCVVSFKDGRLSINNGKGITRDQFVNIVSGRTCRQRSIALPMVKSCFASQYDYDYTITYKTKEGKKRAALIAFRPGYFHGGVEGHESFYRELQVWLGDVLRPIGPSIKLVD